jgi:SET domain-containing protein
MAKRVTNSNWLSPSAETRRSGIDGFGTFARRRIMAGELIAAFGGRVITLAEWRALPEEERRRSLAIHDDLELVMCHRGHPGDGDWINHSCEPNAGIRGQIFLVAMRDIEEGEELTFDYAMVICDPEFRMECRCGRRNCRKIVTGDDWKEPGLQASYLGFFSLYIQDKINKGHRCPQLFSN